jgi:hypothetical protein
MNKKSITALTIAGFIAASISLSACSTGGTNTGNAPAADTVKSSAPAAPAKPVNPAFGQTFTYKDGVSITVSAPVAFTPGQYAAGATQAHDVIFTFTIKNGSTKNLNPVVSPQVTSAGVAGSDVFDSQTPDLAGFPPTAAVLPGGSITWKSGFSVADPTKLIVQVSPAPFLYDDAIFTNTK